MTIFGASEHEVGKTESALLDSALAEGRVIFSQESGWEDKALVRAIGVLLGVDQDQDRVTLQRLRVSSGTGQTVCKLTDLETNGQWVVKSLRAGQRYESHVKKRGELAKLLGSIDSLPLILAFVKEVQVKELSKQNVMILVCPTTQSFDQLVSGRQFTTAECVAAFNAVVEPIFQLWERSLQVYEVQLEKQMAREPKRRTEEILGTTAQAAYQGKRLIHLFDQPLVINGEQCKKSVRNQLDPLYDYHAPTALAWCHNDTNADNFLIKQIDSGWSVWIIDYDYSGLADPRLSLSQLLGWWLCYGVRLLSEPRFILQDKQVHLEYQVMLPRVYRALFAEALKFGLRLETLLVERGFVDSNFWQQVQRYLAQYLLSETRFLVARGADERLRVPFLGMALNVIKGKLDPQKPKSFLDGLLGLSS